MAVIYVTVGAIMAVWTALWYDYMRRHGTASDGPYYWCYGFFFTGVVLIIIGLALGRIGRAARHAEAPSDTTASNAAVRAQQPAVAPTAMPAAAPVAPPAAAPAAMPPAAPGGAVAPGAPAASAPVAYQPR
jgi:hypothetical protein